MGNVNRKRPATFDQLAEVLGARSIAGVYGDEVSIHCPFPGHYRGDVNPSMYFNLRKGCFHCFTCGAKGTMRTLRNELGDDPDPDRHAHGEIRRGSKGDLASIIEQTQAALKLVLARYRSKEIVEVLVDTFAICERTARYRLAAAKDRINFHVRESDGVLVGRRMWAASKKVLMRAGSTCKLLLGNTVKDARERDDSLSSLFQEAEEFRRGPPWRPKNRSSRAGPRKRFHLDQEAMCRY
jgi:hypothetical protein